MQLLFANFSLILLILLIISGAIWCYDRFVLAKRRRAEADATLKAFDRRVAKVKAEGGQLDVSKRSELEKDILKQPKWVEYTGAYFPVIAAVFFIRSFLWEPFRIPSSSMVPTLKIGDFILVSKYSYGLRYPVGNGKFISFGSPKRGDVVVFKFPKDPSIDYIKRVIGVGGDVVEYRGKRLIVNGIESKYQPEGRVLDDETMSYFHQYQERQGGTDRVHQIWVHEKAPPWVPHPDDFPNRDHCIYTADGFTCKVPQGQYFMMGDNRDNSLDSRFWGFVKEDSIVGKAFFVWLNPSHITHFGSIE